MGKQFDITVLLSRWQEGDQDAFSQLSELVYHELKIKARFLMSTERQNHTLQSTALVNETFIKLMTSKVELRDRLHFFSLAGRMMRRILVDHVRAMKRSKRGAGMLQITLNIDDAIAAQELDQFLDLDSALDALSEVDSRKAEILELQFFAGLEVDEIALLYDVSSRTIERDGKFAKAWLSRELAA